MRGIFGAATAAFVIMVGGCADDDGGMSAGTKSGNTDVGHAGMRGDMATADGGTRGDMATTDGGTRSCDTTSVTTPDTVFGRVHTCLVSEFSLNDFCPSAPPVFAGNSYTGSFQDMEHVIENVQVVVTMPPGKKLDYDLIESSPDSKRDHQTITDRLTTIKTVAYKCVSSNRTD